MSKKIYKILCLLLCLCLVFEQTGFAQSIGQLDISSYLTSLRNNIAQDKFRPLHLRYLSYDTLNNNFRLLLDKGDLKDIKAPQVQETAQKLLEYFFVGVSLPNSSFWVNLRPDSPDNIIDPYLAQTDAGKILLEADLQLKKDTAKYTSPENPKGKEYWEKLYKKAGELFGYDNITIPTLTRPWIVPDEIIVREANDNAYIYKATLKVQLEQDHLKDSAVYNFNDPRSKELNEYSSQLIRELIIPELTKEINTSKRYAPLRQVYYSLILAQWFKQKFNSRDGFYGSLIDRRNLNGLISKDDWSKTTYFKEYQKSFQKGEYNITEPISTPFGQTIRSYFSGGIDFGVNQGTGGGIAIAIQNGLVQAATPGDVLAGNSHTLPIDVNKGGTSDNVGVDRGSIEVGKSEEASSPLPISTVSKGTPATLLRYMHDNRIFSDNPKKSSEMAFQRGGNDSLRTIQRELQVLRAVGLVGGNAQDGYYLPEWMRTQDLEAIIKQNQELNFPSPTNEQIESIKIRISERTGVSYKELFQDQLSVEYGGKAAWDIILEKLADKIGFSIPGSALFTIADVWAKFIDANQVLVSEGNSLIEVDLKTYGKVTDETIERLNEILRRFTFPKELEFFICAHTEEFKGWVIARSSGRNEDSYLRNLAGIFISPKKKDERLVVQGVKEIFNHAIQRIWIAENRGESKTDGISNLLTAKEGFGILIQPFLQFDASGTAMTNLYGHTSIEAVIGDADMAVRGIHANTSQFLFNRADPSKFEYNPSFITLPYQCRVRGKEYCAANDPAGMSSLLNSYPKINNRFSPITEAQARELHRVITALEDEIGAPLDVEWGFLEGKLYIIQIRPIIGDFKKPLVEMSPELRTKQVIAQTPIALGHTLSSGFTGRMIVVGDNVSIETIRQFEDEFGKDYIRVQSDVASFTLGSKTRAKVLVDPEQGSRQAHNINLITNRIAAGEFTYCNGPILKNDLLQNLHFVPHPKFKGVWVSDQEVTYFADGLRGVFYESDKRGESFAQDDEYSRQAALLNFHNRVKDTWLKDDIGMPEHAWLLETMRLFRYGAYFGRSIEEMFVDLRHEENCNLDFVQRKIMAFEYQESDFMQIQHELDLLEEALSFPLYPSDWESPRLRSLKNILFLRGISERLKEETQPKQETAIPRRYVVFLLDPYDLRKSAEAQLGKSIEGAQVVRVRSQELLKGAAKIKIRVDQLPSIKTAETISAIYIHVNSYYDFSSLFATLIKIRQGNADALIIIDGNTLSGEEFERFESKHGRIILKTEGVLVDQEIIKLIQEDHFKWAERRKATQQQQAAVSQKAPTKPERLAVLWIENENREIEGVQGKISQSFGSNEEYDFVYAKTMREAVTKMQERKFDIAVFDLLVRSDDDYMLQYRDGLNNIANLYAVTLGGEHVSLMQLHAMFEEGANRIEIIHKPQDIGMDRFEVKYDPFSYVDRLMSIFKDLRQQQIEAYEQSLAEWGARQSQAPTKPEGVNVLFVSDDPDNEEYAVDYFGEIAGTKVKFCLNAGDAIDYMKNNRVDVVIADYNIPMANEKSEDTTYSDSNIRAVLTTAQDTAKTNNRSVALVVFSAWFEKHQEAALRGTAKSIQLFRATEPGLFQKFVGVIKQTHQSLVEDYDRALAQWQATHPQEAQAGKPVAITGQTIFVLSNSSAEATALAKLIQDDKGESCSVTPMDAMWYLERELRTKRPDIVIMDTIIDDKNEIDNIMRLARSKNPNAKFIFTSEEAAVSEMWPKDGNILAVLEKPFHFRDVLRVLNGTYADEIAAARERSKADGHSANSQDKTPPKGTPATLLRYMHSNRIFSDNPQRSSEMANQRGGKDSRRTIQRELAVLREVGLVEGNAQTGYYLSQRLSEVNPESLIDANPELERPSPINTEIQTVKKRICARDLSLQIGIVISLSEIDRALMVVDELRDEESMVGGITVKQVAERLNATDISKIENMLRTLARYGYLSSYVTSAKLDAVGDAEFKAIHEQLTRGEIDDVATQSKEEDLYRRYGGERFILSATELKERAFSQERAARVITDNVKLRKLAAALSLFFGDRLNPTLYGAQNQLAYYLDDYLDDSTRSVAKELNEKLHSLRRDSELHHKITNAWMEGKVDQLDLDTVRQYLIEMNQRMAEISRLIEQLRSQKILRAGRSLSPEAAFHLRSYRDLLEVGYAHFSFVFDVYSALANALKDTIIGAGLATTNNPNDGNIATSSPANPVAGKNPGGVDFRALPIVIQPLNNIPRINMPLSGLDNFRADPEWKEIQNMINAGIIPSGQRIKDYLQSCCQKKELNGEIGRVLNCIADIMRIEEERVSATDQDLKSLLVLLESGKPENELGSALSKIKFSPQEPELIGK